MCDCSAMILRLLCDWCVLDVLLDLRSKFHWSLHWVLFRWSSLHWVLFRWSSLHGFLYKVWWAILRKSNATALLRRGRTSSPECILAAAKRIGAVGIHLRVASVSLYQGIHTYRKAHWCSWHSSAGHLRVRGTWYAWACTKVQLVTEGREWVEKRKQLESKCCRRGRAGAD